MKTRTLTDDPDYDGFDVEVRWKGGSRNSYGGTAVLVDSIRVENPYAVALLYDYVNKGPFGGWVFPYTVLANNKLWLQIHRAASVTITIGATTITITDPNPTMLEVMGPFSLTVTDFNSNTGRFGVTITADGFVAVNNATDPEKTVDWALAFGDRIVITDALVSFKKHDVMFMQLMFEAGQGQADRDVDGRDDYTTVDEVWVWGGPYELEFWPGPPGTGTVRVLVSGHDLNVCILPNNLNTCPNIRDFTGAILFKGPPRAVQIRTYVNNMPSGAVSGEFETRAGTSAYTFTDTRTITGITSTATFDVIQTPQDLGQTPLQLPISITGTGNLDGDATPDSITLDVTLNLQVNPLDIHYAWMETIANAFSITGGTATLVVDLDSDGPPADYTGVCSILAGGPVDVRTYHDPDTGHITINALSTITVTCTLTNQNILNDATPNDAWSVVIVVGMSLVYTYAGPWNSITSITYSSGSISHTTTLVIDINSDLTPEFVTTTGGGIPGPSPVSVSDVDSDVYSNTATLTCTLSGAIPFTGTSTGTLSCNGNVNFEIDINSLGNLGADITVGPIAVTGSGPVTITSTLPTVSISGTISVTSTPVTQDFDNDGANDDRLTIGKTVSISASGTISGTTLTLGPGSSYTVGGADNIDINSAGDPPIDISAPETGSLNLDGATITLSVPPAASGIIFDGTVLSNSFFIAHEGVEQIHLQADLTLEARTQVDDNPAATTTLYVFLWGHGSITHYDVIEVTGAAFIDGGPFNFPLGTDYISAEGTFSLHCYFIGDAELRCVNISIDFDGRSDELSLPISGTIVINNLESFRGFTGTDFFFMEEFERMTENVT
jgi:hypothetical protein